MKQHTIIAKVNDHGTSTTYKKVCRSKSGAIKEARELNCTGLIKRYAEKMIVSGNECRFEFVPASKASRYTVTSSYCSVSIHVEDMEGNNVNACYYGACQMGNDELCETPEECNCDRVWPELAARGFVLA